MSARLFAIAALALLTACGSSTPPPKRSPSGTKQPATTSTPTTAAADAASKTPEQEWSYTSVGRRDPFRSFLADSNTQAGSLSTRCTTPLGRYELDQLRLVAVITGLEDPVAMVETPSGRGYSLRRGVCVGKNGGVVAAVRSGEVIVSEWLMRADGTRDATQTVIRLPAEAAVNPEEAP